MIGGPTSDIYIEKFEGAGTAGITHNGIEISPTTQTVNLTNSSGDRINVRVRTKEFEKYVSFTNVKLTFKTTSVDVNRVIYLTKETSTVSNDNQRLGDFVTEDGQTYVYDLSKYFEENDRETLYFAIRTETAVDIIAPFQEDGIKVVFSRLTQEQGLLNQKYISGNAGRALSYDINLRTGQPFFTKNLVSAGGNLMPMNLNLVFNGIGANEEIFTSMPHGWKTNYHQKVEKDEDNDYYTYVDALGIRHTFNKALNANNIYFDIAGTGFILTVNSDNTVTIDQGYNNYLDFNTNGYLIKIRKVIGVNTIETLINYISGTNKIHNIVDGAGRTLSFAYNTNYIKFNMTGIPEITLNISNSKLVSVTECGGRNSTYNYEEALLINATSDNGEISKFIYDDDCRVVTVEDYYYKNTETLVNRRNIKYIISKTIVTDYKGIETQFGFSNEGECISEFEVTGEGFGRYELTLPNNFETLKHIADRNKYFVYENVTSYSENVEAIRDEDSDKMNVAENKTYLISFRYLLENTYNLKSDEYHKIIVKQGDTEVLSVNLMDELNAEKNAAYLFKSIDGTPFKVYAYYKYNINLNMADTGYTKLSNIKIFEIKKEEVHECVSVNCGTGWQVPFQNGTHWNEISEYMFFSYRDSASGTETQIKEKMYMIDLQETKDNCKRNPNSFYTWYNKKRGLIANTKDVKFCTTNGQHPINSFNVGLAYISSDDEYYKYWTEPTNVSDSSRLKHELITIHRNGVYNTFEKIINVNYQVITEIGFDGLKTNYTYDLFGNVLTITMGQVEVYVKENVYSSDFNYLVTEKSYSGNLVHPNTGELIPSITSYSYDFLGRVLTITKPNGSVITFTYDYNTGYLEEIKEGTGTVNKNIINYLNDNIEYMLGGTKGYSVEYDKYNLPLTYYAKNDEVINTFVRFENQFNNDKDKLIIKYNNDYIEQSEFDKYGNLIIKKCLTDNSVLSNELEIYYSDESADSITVNSPDSENIKKTSRSKLRKVIDKKSNNTQKYYYYDDGLLSEVSNTSDDYVKGLVYTYDEMDRIYTKTSLCGDTLSTTEITYKNSNLYDIGEVSRIENEVERLYNETNYNMTYSKSFTVDNMKRLTKETLELNEYALEKEYTYYNYQGRILTNYPKSVSYNEKHNTSFSLGTINYTYDSMGKIIKIEDTVNYNIIDYAYDQLGRLIREDNQRLNTTKMYSYDSNGNIVNIKYTTYTHDLIIRGASYISLVYNTDYPDRLSKYDSGNVLYDLNGNITNIGNYSFSWERGRLLSSCTKSGTAYTFSYNGLGKRIKKQISTSNYINYTYEGNKLIKERRVNGNDVYDIDYIYLGNEMVGFAMKDKYYYFIKNIQGDIIKLMNSNNTVEATYVYDAWGNCATYDSTGTTNTYSTFIGNINPIRYRGYYYDVETQLFYCNSRYYSPELCRWISPDSIEYLDPSSINGLNLYCYCMNNPIMYADPSGHLPEWAAWLISGAAIVGGIVLCATGVGGILGGVLIGAGAGSLINGYVTEANGGDFTAGYIGGAISGALCGVGAGLGGMAFAAASEVANLACIGYMALGVTASFAGGFAGNLAGTVYTSWHNSGFKSVDINWGETLATSAIMGSLNILAGMGSAMSSIAGSMGRVATDVNSKFALRFLAGLIAGGTEAAYDLTSYLIGKLISAF